MRKPPMDCIMVLDAMREIGHPTTSQEIAEVLPDIYVPAKLKVLRSLGLVRKVGRSTKCRCAFIWKVV